MLRILFVVLLPIYIYAFNGLKSVIDKTPVVIGGSTKPLEYFDPLQLASTPERLTFFREAELKHSRLAMVSAVIIPIVESNVHRPAIYEFSNLSTNYQLLIICLMFISEFGSMLKGWQDPRYKRFALLPDYQPGDFGFNVSGIENANLVDAELNNGRLAMIACIYTIVSELLSK
jgi:hypothetical protein